MDRKVFNKLYHTLKRFNDESFDAAKNRAGTQFTVKCYVNFTMRGYVLVDECDTLYKAKTKLSKMLESVKRLDILKNLDNGTGNFNKST